MANTYELMLVLRSEFAADESLKLKELVSKLTGSGTKILETTLLGKKQLAFPINKQTEGIYVKLMLESDVLKSAELEKKAKLTESVLRYLLLRR